MPIYEYVCEHCSYEFEALQKMRDEALKACPDCDNESLKKKVSAAAFRLKGGGWYETDFKSGEKKNLVAGEGSSSASKDDAKTEKKGESTTSDKPPEKKTTKNADSA